MELARPTGNFLQQGDTTLIEVLLGGKSCYAAVCLPFGYYFTPSKEWLEKWSREVVCWVAYEQGDPAHLVVVGYRPLASKTPPDYPRAGRLKSEHFLLEFNDAKKAAFFGLYEDFGVTVEDGPNGSQLRLGEGREAAVLGDTLVRTLDELAGHLAKLRGVVQQVATACLSFGVPVPPTVLPSLAELAEALEKTKQGLPEVKSTKIKLD